MNYHSHPGIMGESEKMLKHPSDPSDSLYRRPPLPAKYSTIPVITRKFTPEERFWLRVNKTGTCWLWTGAAIGHNGYGALRVNGRKTKTHRYSWELHNGPIPQDKRVLHTCDVPLCVNPAHLFLGTPADNAHDRDVKGRQRCLKGQDNIHAKLTAKDVVDIRNSSLSVKTLASHFRVTTATINNILSRRNWRSV